jgi:hypothetical protein
MYPTLPLINDIEMYLLKPSISIRVSVVPLSTVRSPKIGCVDGMEAILGHMATFVL